ncbi:MAG: N(4)-(beta-N-acetylglucosaminyl)-L-asparaginase [Planctomycetota bacterium]
MSERVSRREFLGRAAVGAAAGAAACGACAALDEKPSVQSRPVAGPVVIASANGEKAVELARKLLLEGSDPLDAAIAGVNLVEEDPRDMSVGYGGLPNEEGVVELDSCVMHGPTHRAGAVAALRNIKTPSKVARLVMKYTDHILLVGEGALRFARAHGFKDEDLLTDEAREAWLRWKSKLSDRDDWLPYEGGKGSSDANVKSDAHVGAMLRHWGTIHCSARTAAGDFGGVTTTSGLAFKIPGRVGDSPIIGAGNYLDNEIGSAGATGRGEAVILTSGSFLVVEKMRQGLEPTEACLEVLKRIAAQSKRNGLVDGQLVDSGGKPTFDVRFYALRKDGVYGGASMLGKGRMAVADAEGVRPIDIPSLFT